MATDTFAETRKKEGKLDALVNLVTQDSMASVLNRSLLRLGVHDVAIDTSAETGKVEGKLDALVNFVTQLYPGVNEHPETYAPNNYSRPPQQQRPDSYTSAETRKVEGKLDSLVNLVTQLAVNQKPASVARVCGIRSSNDHHTNGVHEVATDTSAQTRKVEGKLDALVNLVTQLYVNQKHASVARRSYDVDTDTSDETRKVESKLDALMNLVTQLAVNQKAASNARVFDIRSSKHHHTNATTVARSYDVAADTSTKTIKVEGNLDPLMNLVTQLAVNQKPASVARQPGVNEHPEAYALQTSIASYHKERGQTLDREDGFQLQVVSVQEMMPLSLKEFMTWLQIHLLKLESYRARNDAIVIKEVYDVATNTSVETRKVERKLDVLVNLVTQLAVNQKPASIARRLMIQISIEGHQSSRRQRLDREVGFQLQPVSVQEMMSLSLEEFTTWLQIHLLKLERGVHDVATNTSAKNIKVEGRLDATVNLVTQLAVNRKPASVARVRGIRSSNDHHTNVCPSSFSARKDSIVIRGVHDVATDTSAECRKVEGKLDALVNLVTQLAVNRMPASVAKQPGGNEHPEAYAANIYSRPPQQQRYICFETTKVEGKLDAIGNLVAQIVCESEASLFCKSHHSSRGQTLDKEDSFQLLAVTQLAVNPKPASVAIVCGIRSSNDHHTNRSSRRGYDTSAETRKVEGKLDALMNLVTQLAVNWKPASVARVCGIRSSNDHHTNQPGVNEHPEAYAANVYRRHHSSRGQTLDREDGFQLLAVSVQEMMPLSLDEFTTRLQIHQLKLESFSARNDAISIRGVHDLATDTSAETRKVEGKLDALVNLVTQLAVNQKPTSVARVFGIRSSNDHHTNRRWLPTPSSFRARNDVIVIRGVHDSATDTSAESRKVQGKLDAHVNLVTQLAVNQKPGSVARVCGIRSSNDHHTNLCPSFFSARNDFIVIRGVHDVPTDTSAETRKVEGKLDALVNLVTQLAVNQKPASVVRVCGIRSSNDHHTDRRWLPTPSSFNATNDAIVIRGVHDMATDTSAETSKVEGKIDALVNLVTQLAVNQKPASVARVCGIRSSNDHHTNVCPSYFNARNDAIVIRGVHDVTTDTSAETRNEQGKLDALVNLVTQLAVNQKPASVARVCGIRSSNDHHRNVRHHSSRSQTLDREDGFQLLAVSVQEMMPLSLEEFTTWLQIHLLKLERWKAS
ncbi:hypothetical protein Fmac_024833 [Flemingia macrophylla]|uniref:Uncharacterized protein n=1 Tax=Flemingia macrophylla TaxID=520843 RepID=A0ABD1LS79_9FABA